MVKNKVNNELVPIIKVVLEEFREEKIDEHEDYQGRVSDNEVTYVNHDFSIVVQHNLNMACELYEEHEVVVLKNELKLDLSSIV